MMLLYSVVKILCGGTSIKNALTGKIGVVCALSKKSTWMTVLIDGAKYKFLESEVELVSTKLAPKTTVFTDILPILLKTRLSDNCCRIIMTYLPISYNPRGGIIVPTSIDTAKCKRSLANTYSMLGYINMMRLYYEYDKLIPPSLSTKYKEEQYEYNKAELKKLNDDILAKMSGGDLYLYPNLLIDNKHTLIQLVLGMDIYIEDKVGIVEVLLMCGAGSCETINRVDNFSFIDTIFDEKYVMSGTQDEQLYEKTEIFKLFIKSGIDKDITLMKIDEQDMSYIMIALFKGFIIN